MNGKPIIGLPMRLEIETGRFYLGRDYSEALEALGAIPLQISLIPNEAYLAEVLKIVGGILLPGSDTDVNPLIFGEEPKPKLKKVVSEKDATDLIILDIAEKLERPILAICYGMQVLNVSRGGTLFQDIETEIEECLKHEQGKPLGRNSHSIGIDKESSLFRLLTKEKIEVNSHHHQAVKNVGKNLKAVAWAKDSVIEGIEDVRPNRFVRGFQWHPELSWKKDENSRMILESLINACR